MFSSVKCALRFFLMRKASDFKPQGSTLVTAPPSEAIFDLDLLRQRLDLLLRDVLARQEDVLVESHFGPFQFNRVPRGALRARERLEPDVRRREHGRTDTQGPAARSLQDERAALRSAPGGTQRSGPHTETWGSRQGKIRGRTIARRFQRTEIGNRTRWSMDHLFLARRDAPSGDAASPQSGALKLKMRSEGKS